MFISKQELASIRANFPIGSTVKLMSEMTDDPDPIEQFSFGTVDHIDDAGSVHIRWQNGRLLAALHGVDEIKKVVMPSQ